MLNNLNTKLQPQRGLLVLFIYFALASICLLVFQQVRNFDFVNYDDNEYVYDNQHVLKGLTPGSIAWAFTTSDFGYWQPLTWCSLMLDCQLFGANPGWMHLVNLFWHLVNTLLLFEVLRRMTGSLWPGAFVAAAFAIHPMHVESVAWIAERKDVLSTFFMLITLAVYTSYVKCPSVYRYLAALVFFVFGLMAKPMLVTLPFVLLLLDYWPLKRFETPGQGCLSQQSISIPCRQGVLCRLIIEKVPFVIISILSGIVSVLTQQDDNVILDAGKIPWMDRIGDIVLSYGFYLEKLFWPKNLAVPYSTTAGGSVSWVQCALYILLLTGVTFLVLRFGRNRKYLPVGWFWFIGTLVPVIGFVRFTGASYADRFTYIPYIGLFIMLAWGLPELLLKRRYHRAILGLAMVIALSALGLCSYRQVSYWNNSISLLSHTIKVTQNNWMAHYNLGLAYNALARYQEAIEAYQEAIRIKPNYVETYNNLGLAYNGLARYQEAIEAYQEAIRIKPNYAEAYSNIGLVYHSLARYREAIEAFNRSIQLKPDLVGPYNNLGKTYADLGNPQKAAEFFKQAVRIQPDDPEVNNNLGAAYYNLGRFQDAIEAYQKSIRIKPDYSSAYVNLGNVYGDLERYPEAIEAYRQAVKISPQNARAHCNLGAVYYVLGQLPKAIEAFKQAAQIDPAYAKAHFSLGLAYLELDGKESALKEYEILKTLDAEMATKLYEMINP